MKENIEFLKAVPKFGKDDSLIGTYYHHLTAASTTTFASNKGYWDATSFRMGYDMGSGKRVGPVYKSEDIVIPAQIIPITAAEFYAKLTEVVIEISSQIPTLDQGTASEPVVEVVKKKTWWEFIVSVFNAIIGR